MKIIGGSYGLGGSAWLSSDKKLVVEGARGASFTADQITAMNASSSTTSKVGIGSVLIGILVLGGGGFYLFGILGLIAGLFLTFVGSRYTETAQQVQITFEDLSSLTLSCTRQGVKRLFAFWGGDEAVSSSKSGAKDWVIVAFVFGLTGLAIYWLGFN